MADDLDYELVKTDAEQTSAAPVNVRLAIVVGVLALVVAALAGFLIYVRTHAPAPSTASAKPAESAPQVRPLGSVAEPIVLPPLDESDAVVRELVRKITSHPAALAWLATNGLIRNFTVVVENVADGATPARQLRVLQPAAPFQIAERDGAPFIDARSYQRYDGIAAAAASIDPPGAARLYATLKPRIDDAYAQLGHPPGAFDATLERAIIALLRTPAIDGPIRVEPKGGIAYQYADPKLEGLTAAQRHLLRTGPQNVRTIQSALRQIALALGIPSERLR